jgi:hypothetical protein
MRQTYLSQLVKIDLAQTDRPFPDGTGQWKWVRYTGHRIRLTERARRDLGRAEVVVAYDRQGRPAGIAYGQDRLQRIMSTGIAEPVRMLRVVLDGTARRLGTDDTDLELLVAACRVAHDESGEADEAPA